MKYTLEDLMKAQREHLEVEADPTSGTHCRSAYWQRYTRTLEAYEAGREISEPPC